MPRSLRDRLSGISLPQRACGVGGPLWKGPEEDGITFSLLSQFLVCRERFRVRVIEGLSAGGGFNHRIEYGSMWHTCEEALSAVAPAQSVSKASWEPGLRAHAERLSRQHPGDREAIWHWYNVCRIQFPAYVRYWRQQPDVKTRTPILQEGKFAVPYTLPSGRVVKLRGKWDAVDLIDGRIYLQENKTKGDIRPEMLKRQLTFDLQTMIYLVALQTEQQRLDDSTVKARLSYRQGGERHFSPIGGVRYNVVRRPLSGGKGTIVRHKPTKSNPKGESEEDFYKRLSGIIEAEPEHYFMRWRVEIHSADIQRFRRECLDPILEQLCDWWNWISSDACRVRGPFDCATRPGIHWRHPFGVYNSLDEGGCTDLDAYLDTGSEVGLRRITTLFPELDD